MNSTTAYLDHPPAAPLTAFMQDNQIDTDSELFGPDVADRLAELTATLLRPVVTIDNPAAAGKRYGAQPAHDH